MDETIWNTIAIQQEECTATEEPRVACLEELAFPHRPLPSTDLEDGIVVVTFSLLNPFPVLLTLTCHLLSSLEFLTTEI